MVSIANSKFYTFDVAPEGGGTAIPFGLRLSNKYDAIATDCGLTPHADEASAKGMKITPSGAVRQGLMISLRINFRKSTGGRGATNIVVPRNKALSAMENIPGKAWGDSTITSCRDQVRLDYR